MAQVNIGAGAATIASAGAAAGTGNVSSVRLVRARLDQRRFTDHRTGGPLTCSGNGSQGTAAWGLAEFRRTVITSASRSSVTPSNQGGPEGTKAQLNPWCEQTSGGNCNKQKKTLNNLNNEQTLKRESEGSPQWTRLAPSCESSGDRGITKNEMGDRSVISTPGDTQGKLSRGAYDDARNVKDSKERAVDGNALPPLGAVRPRLKGMAKSAKANSKTNANKGKSEPVMPTAPGRVSYEDIYNIDNLRAGYERLRENVAPGIDGRTKADMTDKGLAKLSSELRRQTYAPKTAERIMIPKPNGGSRPLSVASTVDKVVQSTLKGLVEPLFEPFFRDSSHGFRPGRSCHTALLDLRYSWTAMTWLVQIDIKKDFDKIHHDLLLEEMEPVLQSKALQDLMRKLLVRPVHRMTMSYTCALCSAYIRTGMRE